MSDHRLGYHPNQIAARQRSNEREFERRMRYKANREYFEKDYLPPRDLMVMEEGEVSMMPGDMGLRTSASVFRVAM